MKTFKQVSITMKIVDPTFSTDLVLFLENPPSNTVVENHRDNWGYRTITCKDTTDSAHIKFELEDDYVDFSIVLEGIKADELAQIVESKLKFLFPYVVTNLVSWVVENNSNDIMNPDFLLDEKGTYLTSTLTGIKCMSTQSYNFSSDESVVAQEIIMKLIDTIAQVGLLNH